MLEDNPQPAAEERIDLLRNVQLFEALTDDDLRLIAGVVDELEMEEGSVLFEAGDSADHFYIVVDGAVEIFRSDGEGGEELMVAPDPRSASARVVEAAHLLAIARDDFEWLLGGDSLAVRILSGLSRALREIGVRFASVERIEDPGAFVRQESDDVRRSMQASLLPRKAPRVSGFDVAAGTTTEDTGLDESDLDDLDDLDDL